MKLFVKTMLALLVIAGLAPFTILKGPDGDTLARFSDFGMPDLPFRLPGFKLPEVSTISPAGEARLQTADEFHAVDENLQGKDIFYRWLDADGNIQFTSKPPVKGVEYTVKGYDPDANVIPAVKTPRNIESESKPSADKNIEQGETGNPYSADGIKKLFEDAKNIEKMLEQRYNEQNELLNQ